MHGSLQEVNINGVGFIPPADVDVNITTNKWDNEAVPNGSGPASIQSVRKVPGASNIVIRADSTEMSLLKGWADSAEWTDFFIRLRDGSVWDCRGLIKLDDASTANGTIPLTVQCETDWNISAA